MNSDERAPRIWANGRLVSAGETPIDAQDFGFTLGLGVFTTLGITQGQPFALARHLRRLQHDASRIGLDKPDDTAIQSGIAAVLAARTDGRLRITATAQTLMITWHPPAPEPSPTLVTSPWVRNERSALAGVKSTSYAENVLALADANRRGAGEAVLGNSAGKLCEGSRSNIFYVVDGQLRTPALESGCLPGITRELILAWVGACETSEPLAALGEADEVFTTSAVRGIRPIAEVDGRAVRAPGRVTAEAMRTFAVRAAEHLDP